MGNFIEYIGEKKLSVGLILTDGTVFLSVEITGRSGMRDIPKGEVDKGESLKDALIREIKEECNISISKYRSQLQDMGQFEYMSHKDVHVFVLKTDDLPPASNMKCTSTFKLYGRDIPEVRNHRYVKFNELHLFNKYMANIINTVRGDYEIK
jgi:8-oxo-dGTP pyrophosphatase MutT (NUDIX family)